MADVVHYNYQLIPIISRFNIPFGFGDKNAEQVCTENKVNTVLFVEIVNTFIDDNYSPTENLRAVPLKDTVNYLLNSHRFFNQIKLPLIESLIHELNWKDQEQNKNKELLNTFFEGYKKEVVEHTSHEEKEVYPFVLQLEKCYHNKDISEDCIKKLKQISVQDHLEEHDELNSALLDLKNIIIKYLPPADNHRITNRILTEIFRLEKDMADHTRIEDTVLLPIAFEMETEIRKLMK